MYGLIKTPEGFDVRLRGIIPNPPDAPRGIVQGAVDGEGNVIVKTVPAGKILFIPSAWLSSRESISSGGTLDFYIRNNLDVYVNSILMQIYDIAGQQTLSIQHCPALEVPAGYDIMINSNNSNIDAWCGFSYWLEDA